MGKISKARRTTHKGEAAQNVAVDTTGAVAKVSAAVVGAAVIGTVKGLSKAVWRGARPRR